MRLTKRLALIGSLALVHLGAFSPAAIAADPPFPASQVNMIVPAAAGSGVDVLGRLIGRKLSAMWNQPVVTENVPGASGNIGHARGAKAKPDGLTILMGFAGPMSIIPNIDATFTMTPLLLATMLSPASLHRCQIAVVFTSMVSSNMSRVSDSIAIL